MSPENREMAGFETSDQEKADKFREKMTDHLLLLMQEMNDIAIMNPQTFPADKAREIEAKLDELADEAGAMGDEAKKLLLRNMGSDFYNLHTVGIVEDRDRFAREAYHISDRIESILLALDGTSSSNKGKALEMYKRSRQ